MLEEAPAILVEASSANDNGFADELMVRGRGELVIRRWASVLIFGIQDA